MSTLGRSDGESEAEHLRRVADELGGAKSSSLSAIRSRLVLGSPEDRRIAAAELGTLGDRNAIALLRGLLEGDEPENWELAVHGLRQSGNRAGWLCLESVALAQLPTLAGDAPAPDHAFRLLVMGRTKTMDRLFRAVDGHSRAISAGIAINFADVAVRSVPGDMFEVMALRLGIDDRRGTSPRAPEQISGLTGYSLEAVRRIEAEAWETLQRSRSYREIWRNYEVNNDRLRATD